MQPEAAFENRNLAGGSCFPISSRKRSTDGFKAGYNSLHNYTVCYRSFDRESPIIAIRPTALKATRMDEAKKRTAGLSSEKKCDLFQNVLERAKL
jgi:hypothetical protein